MDSITVAKLKTAIDADAVVIDVREGYEFDEGHVPSATHIPMASIPTRMEELTKQEPIWLICASGNRSGQVAEYLTRHGYLAINVDGGTLAWLASGFPIEK